MILKSFSIENYRSILKIKKLKFSPTLTTFIGKNNQGKSNILHAISLIFDVIKYLAEIYDTETYPWRWEIPYKWSSDFPIHKQKENIKENTIISIDFEMSDKEVQEIKKEIDIDKISKNFTITTILKKEREDLLPNIELSFKNFQTIYDSDNDLTKQFCSWLLKKINFQYIPAIRTDKLAEQITNNVISLELSQLGPKKRESLENALIQIEKLQKPILEKLEKNLSKTLKDFVPEIKSVSIIERRSSYNNLRRYSDENDFFIRINDGSETVLSQKGDGVKSLITLGMMRQKGSSNIGKGLILAIEEPESHLHPSAIRQISRVISDISEKNQIIVTSHSPLFVNRNQISENIIVGNHSAYNPTNMKQIRDVLGIIASDNLINSEFSIVVEGQTDKNLLYKYISKKSKILSKMFKDKRLCFEVMNGVSNLENSLNKLNNMSSKYFCVLDSDQIAINNVKKAKDKSLLSPELREVVYYTIDGLKEVELEDLIEPTIYENYIYEQYGIKITESKIFCANKKIWSQRIKEAFKENGKLFEEDDLNDHVENIKVYISNIDMPINKMIITNRNTSLDNLIVQLENYFTNK